MDRLPHPSHRPQAGLGASGIVLLETQESQEVGAGSLAPTVFLCPLLPACLLRPGTQKDLIWTLPSASPQVLRVGSPGLWRLRELTWSLRDVGEGDPEGGDA